MAATITIITMRDPSRLLRLLQLSSPTLPVGAYAYSDGLETAVQRGWVASEESARAWILGRLGSQVAELDMPLLRRLYRAWRTHDPAAVTHWSALLLAHRDTRETRTADRQLGRALARLLVALDIADARVWRDRDDACFAALFALAAAHWDIAVEDTVAGYAWAWTDNQVAAAIKLVPLGQTAGQRILLAASAVIPALVAHSARVVDADIGASAPAASIASAAHEAQYTRLFRS